MRYPGDRQINRQTNEQGCKHNLNEYMYMFTITHVITYMKKFCNSDWLRPVRLISKSANLCYHSANWCYHSANLCYHILSGKGSAKYKGT